MKRQNENTTRALDAENPPGANLDRRAFLRRGGAGAAALGSLPLWSAAASRAADAAAATQPAPTVSQPPLPVVDARFPCRIADGVWIVPDKRTPLVPNIGLVEGSKAVLVVDAGLTVESGRNVLAAARALAGKRELILTVTHAHPEHTFGAQAFREQARIYYNQLQRDYLVREGEKLLASFRADVLPPERRPLLDGVEVTLAGDVYAGDHATLDLGGRTVEFRTWGVAHSPGDQVITVPDQGVVFAGDLIEERMFPIVPYFPPLIRAADINVRTWEITLKEITEQAPRILVPGHGNLGGTEIAKQVAGYLAEVRRLVAAAGHGEVGATSAQALQQLEAQVRNLHPTWERTEFIAPALQYFALEGAGA